MHERRRLALAARQTMIARLGQRQAMRSLAEALVEEQRSQHLAQRSRTLVAASGVKPGEVGADTLAARTAFAAGLAGIAANAAFAAGDAARQAAWQAEALGHAESRLKRLEERERSARQALDQALTKREDAHNAGLARKLQRSKRA